MTRTIIVLLLLATAALLPARAAADWMSDSWHCLDASGYDDCSAGHYFGQWGYTYSALANHHDQALLPYFASTGARLEIQSLAQRLDAILARGQFGVFAPDRYSVEQRGNRTVARPGGLFEILFDCLQCSLFRVWRNGELEYSGTSGSVHRDPGEGTHNYTIELCESGRRGTRCVDSYLTVVVSGDTSEPLLNLAQSAERVIVEPDGGECTDTWVIWDHEDEVCVDLEVSGDGLPGFVLGGARAGARVRIPGPAGTGTRVGAAALGGLLLVWGYDYQDVQVSADEERLKPIFRAVGGTELGVILATRSYSSGLGSLDAKEFWHEHVHMDYFVATQRNFSTPETKTYYGTMALIRAQTEALAGNNTDPLRHADGTVRQTPYLYFEG